MFRVSSVWFKRFCYRFLIISIIGGALPLEVPQVQAEPKSATSSPSEVQTQEMKGPKKLAIVIDDLGNDMDGTEEIMAMPIKLTVAVMPFLRSTKRDAQMAHERGFDVLVHLPMEPIRGKPEWLGPGAIISSMSDSEIRRKVEQAIDDVPYAVGINNHMGSKITANPRIMSIILDVCRERGLFFLDSRTNYKTVVGKLCKEKGMPDIGNQFFLDDQCTSSHITRQMNKVMTWMEDHERCVIIGHVGLSGTKTASVIRNSISKMDVEYVTLSELVHEQHAGQSNPLLDLFP